MAYFRIPRTLNPHPGDREKDPGVALKSQNWTKDLAARMTQHRHWERDI